MRQKPFTAAQLAALRKPTGYPIVKFFCPWGPQTWLISEYHPDDEVAFGLADLGFGCPEMGDIYMPELIALRHPSGLTIERDLHFTANKTLVEYADEARARGHLVA